jgi:hypothetical protein
MLDSISRSSIRRSGLGSGRRRGTPCAATENRLLAGSHASLPPSASAPSRLPPRPSSPGRCVPRTSWSQGSVCRRSARRVFRPFVQRPGKTSARPEEVARKRPCTICRRWFRPDPRVGDRQRACSKPECLTARRQKTQPSWRSRNAGYALAWRIDRRAAQTQPPELLRLPAPLNQQCSCEPRSSMVQHFAPLHHFFLRG